MVPKNKIYKVVADWTLMIKYKTIHMMETCICKLADVRLMGSTCLISFSHATLWVPADAEALTRHIGVWI